MSVEHQGMKFVKVEATLLIVNNLNIYYGFIWKDRKPGKQTG